MSWMNTTKRNGKAERRRHSPDEIVKRVAEYRRSGLSQGQYAERAGVKLSSLRNWLYRREQRPAKPGGLTAVEVTSAGQPMAGSTVTVRWPNGVQAEVALGADVAAMVRMIRELVA